ncbi:type IV pilin [Vibrio sp. S4M6]|uniref:type IV pilus modification PilV family protein n=1 Tax=Vibrio sinus TaxID=2946865 RepID=UPI00202AB1D5|nr:type IV pilin [Vibrio sinus]MCL9783921.1 type IV pilin [Vibrio sinus]
MNIDCVYFTNLRAKALGLTFIDVMTALFILSLGTLSLVKLQLYAEKSADWTSASIQALNLAEAKLEWFRTRGADQEKSSIPVASFKQDIVSGKEQIGETYLMVWKVTSVAPLPSLKHIIVTVSWSDRFSKPQQVMLQTYLSQYSEFD